MGCVVSRASHSHTLLRASGECAINVPAAALVDTVVDIGNCSGAEVDKFDRFGLTALPAHRIAAPLVGECFAHLECRVADGSLVQKYDFFILEVVRAQAALRPRRPQTLHYTGDGVFMVGGTVISRRGRFAPGML